MSTTTQFDQDLFRILLYQNNATELLLETAPDGLRLPVVSVSAHLRVAAEVTAAIKSSWNLRTYCLFPFLSDSPSHAPVRCQVVEVCQPDARPPAGMQWLPVISLSGESFEDLGDFAAIQSSLTILDQHRQGKLPGVFGKPGWLQMVTEWVEAQTTSAGLCLTGEFRQLNASPTFSLIRFETKGPAIWFKAVGEPNLHEYRITLKLASVFPDFVPRVISSQPEWNAWIALESKGSYLDANSTGRAWAAAAENLALLQISSFGRRFELIKAGCKDLRMRSLLSLVDPFLEAMAELMARQTKFAPASVSRQELLLLGRDITSALEEFSESAIPDTLGHLDVNPGNVIVSKERCAFLDWAEAYVGPPFFTFRYLLEYMRRLRAANSHYEKSLESAYAGHWTSFASAREVETAFHVVPLLAAFTYAAGSGSWRNPERIRHENAAYLRSLTRRMKHEAASLQNRRFTCVP